MAAELLLCASGVTVNMDRATVSTVIQSLGLYARSKGLGPDFERVTQLQGLLASALLDEQQEVSQSAIDTVVE